jgi:alkyl hydroperoxide reductase subunit AhpC
MSQIAGREGTLAMLGVEVIAVPTDADRDAIRRLGEDPRVLFPVVTDGAESIVTTYRLFAAAPHTEFLIDRQGYVRTIAKGRGQAEEMEPLLARIQELNQERVPVEPPPDEHVH